MRMLSSGAGVGWGTGCFLSTLGDSQPVSRPRGMSWKMSWLGSQETWVYF